MNKKIIVLLIIMCFLYPINAECKSISQEKAAKMYRKKLNQVLRANDKTIKQLRSGKIVRLKENYNHATEQREIQRNIEQIFEESRKQQAARKKIKRSRKNKLNSFKRLNSY